MPQIENTTSTEDIRFALDVEMIENFQHDQDRLAEVLGIVTPEVVNAGTALEIFRITGELNSAVVSEGEEVPLTKYQNEPVSVEKIKLKKFRRLTTAEAIQQGGYDRVMLRSDRRMLSQIRNNIISEFFSFLEKGTGEAEAKTLQGAIAMADGVLKTTLENNNDDGERILHFVNTMDVAEHLAEANITTQDHFGMRYVKNFLGMEHCFITSRVPEGKVIVTCASNLHLYSIDFATLADAGLDYTVTDESLIGVKHEPNYGRVGAEVHAITGFTLFAEVLDYIVIATFKEGSPDMLNAKAAGAPAIVEVPSGNEGQTDTKKDGAPDRISAKSNKSELTAYAEAHGISLEGCSTNADIWAAIQEAEDGLNAE